MSGYFCLFVILTLFALQRSPAEQKKRARLDSLAEKRREKGRNDTAQGLDKNCR
jgi:hypothetical protein